MPNRAGWLELAASGMDVAALAAAGWYLVVRSIERDRRSANRTLAEFNELKKSFERDGGNADRSLPDSYPSLAAPVEDRGGEGTEAEELLAASMLRSGQSPLNSILDAVFRWWERIWRDMRIFGWFRVPLLAPIGLVFLVLFAAVCVIRLPVVAIGYLFDTRNDFRLRIIVLAFALGLALQVLRASIG